MQSAQREFVADRQITQVEAISRRAPENLGSAETRD